MKYVYVVLGAGRQGTAIAYDLMKFGKTARIILTDSNIQRGKTAQRKLQNLAQNMDFSLDVSFAQLDASNQKILCKFFRHHKPNACVNALPYFMTPKVNKTALECGVSICDLGGNTDLVLKMHKDLNKIALKNNATLVPDCGLAPGLAMIIATHLIKGFDKCESLKIYCGGLPQKPKPPLNYKMLFSAWGLINEYFGKAYVINNGKVVKKPTFTNLETLNLPIPGKFEAIITSGGLSTMPFSFKSIARQLEYKTIRYQGHYEKFKLLLDLGLLDEKPLNVDGANIIPRKMLAIILEKTLDFPDDEDMVILKLICCGTKSGIKKTAGCLMIDYHDKETGFTAMERTTGFPTSIIAIMMAQNMLKPGVLYLEKDIDTNKFWQELSRRGFKIKKT